MKRTCWGCLGWLLLSLSSIGGLTVLILLAIKYQWEGWVVVATFAGCLGFIGAIILSAVYDVGYGGPEYRTARKIPQSVQQPTVPPNQNSSPDSS